jgi:hypothetical protein
LIILKWIFRKWDVGDMDWIDLAQDRDRWWEIVEVVMNLRVPKQKCGEFLDQMRAGYVLKKDSVHWRI